MGLVKSQLIEAYERGWSSEDTYVCDRCVDDDFLKDLIAQHATQRICSYCNRRGRSAIAAEFDKLMEAVSDTVYHFYNEPASAGVPWDDGPVVESISTEAVLVDLGLECNDKLFEDIRDSFNDQFWVPTREGHWVSLHDSVLYESAWHQFVHQIKHQTRFFFGAIPDEESPDPHEIGPGQTLQLIDRLSRRLELVRTLATGTTYTRSRLRHDSDNWPLTAENLGAPPPEDSRAGRMNPAGISYLYMAFDEATAICEVVRNPPVALAIGTFEATRDLTVLDLCQLPAVPSVFDSSQRSDREGLLFLKRFIGEISRPVRKDGFEHIDYVPSQVVCEYFARVATTGSADVPLDGIVYPSAIRPGGRNLVLFPEDSWSNPFSTVRFIGAIQRDIETWPELVQIIT